MNVLFAGGGTGGHLIPGIALANALQRLAPDCSITFVGTNQGLDATLVPAHGFSFVALSAGRGSPLYWRRPLNLPRFFWAIGQAVSLMRRLRPDVVVALGGFAAAAPGIAARICGVPLVVLEQNTIPGRVNRLLARWARTIHLQFDEARSYFAHSRAEILHSGSPLLEPICALATHDATTQDALLVMGGSQGADALNRLVIDAALTIVENTGARILHVAGDKNKESVRRAYEERGVAAQVFGFCDTMPQLYAQTRMAICRSGAMSLAELEVAGIPSVLIPLPSAKDDHQRVNAQVLVKQGGALLCEQERATAEDLATAVCGLWTDEEHLRAMANVVRSLSKPDAAAMIAAQVCSLAKAKA